MPAITGLHKLCIDEKYRQSHEDRLIMTFGGRGVQSGCSENSANNIP